MIIMKKQFKFLVAALTLSTLAANAQQLPNVGFDSWGKCEETTWTSTMYNKSFTRPGNEPTDWNGSSVKPFNISQVLCKQGTDSGNYAQILNYGVLSNNIPGYLCIAQPWVFVGGTGVWNAGSYAKYGDGGSHNSYSFTYRPDALRLRAKRADENPKTEISHIIAYLWSGTFKSKVPSSATTGGAITYGAELDDVDRVVLGRQDDENVTAKGTLIAKLDYEITSSMSEWTDLLLDLEYVNTTEAPTKANVICSASDYWTRANIQSGTTLYVDDVDFVYYSRLKSLTIGGNAISLEDGVYTYNMKGALPSVSEVVATCKSQWANAAVTVDEANYQLKVVVTNQGGKDSDGKTSHTYILQYVKPTNYNGYLTIQMKGEWLASNKSSIVQLTEYDDNTGDFVLPNFSIPGFDLGNIIVPGCSISKDGSGVKNVNGSVAEMLLPEGSTVDKGAIVAKVDLNGTITVDGKATMIVDVIWFTDGDITNTAEDNMIPIPVKFSSDRYFWRSIDGFYYVLDLDNNSDVITRMPTTLSECKVIDSENDTLGYSLTKVQFLDGTPNEHDLYVGAVTIGEDNEKYLSGTHRSGNYNSAEYGKIIVDGGVKPKGYFTDSNLEELYKDAFIFNFTIVDQNKQIVFTPWEATSGVDNAIAAKTFVYGVKGGIFVAGYEGAVQVLTVDGRLASNTAVADATLLPAATGIYIVRMGNIVKKVIVK